MDHYQIAYDYYVLECKPRKHKLFFMVFDTEPQTGCNNLDPTRVSPEVSYRKPGWWGPGGLRKL